MKVYIIHVSDNFAREQYIRNQLENKIHDFEFINEGDKKMLNAAILKTYFSGEMEVASGATSCAYKHVLALEKLLKTNEKYAFIIEDDLRLYKNFEKEFRAIKQEIIDTKLENFMLSLEDSDLRYIPKSERKKGKRIYISKNGTTAAAYIVDRKAAENMLNYLKNNKMHEPVDWFHATCIRENIFSMYRSYPPLGYQGSFDGTTVSLISNNRVGMYRIITYKIQKIYKRIIYFFR